MTTTPATADTSSTRLLWLVFFASGLAGLIYESIWTHYLKLFLGHAAYAQTLVLGIFMGGMAAGAAIVSRFSMRIRNPLRVYAAVEAIIGCFAFAFHPIFILATNGFYDASQAWNLGASGVVAGKWALAALLIVPQSLLLGATFPLFAAGGIRRSAGGSHGSVISMLYFANSIGGAIGVLVSGFLLIPAVGLPGTIVTAGVLNLLIAVIVFRGNRDTSVPAAPTATGRRALGGEEWFLLAVSFLTGATSFVYEVGWIRMLSLVLGSATHAFELMLSAFITGLAFGGLWVRKRIDVVAAPGVFLGYVQLAMGCAAIATLPLHNLSFDLVAWMVKTAPKTDDGYAMFNLVRYGVAAIIMFPAAFCAGMTLPMVTRILYSRPGQQERAIGLVYGANTFGAISGLAFAALVGMPFIGLNYLVASGALVDVLIGMALILVYGGARKVYLGVATSLVCGVGTIATAATFDPQKLVSGVFRTGQAKADGQIIKIAHGRTATISTELDQGAISIRTNGKVDASAMPGFPAHYRMDEVTMTLLAAIPLMLHPAPRTVANIGFGSGITGQTLLGDPRIGRLDSIEIEPQMVELARAFTGRNDRLFSDPRSRIHIDDAKAFFATAGKRYDLIVSEPSNPWVSGVAGLFSKEFYRHVVRYMEHDGLFAQWLQVYESHPDRVASVLLAVDEVFDDYVVVALNFGDLLIIARPQGQIRFADSDLARLSPEIRQWLSRLDVANDADMTLRVMADKALLGPWLKGKAVPANSDFHPYVDTHADRDRFIGHSVALPGLALSAYPIPELMGVRPPLPAGTLVSINQHFGVKSPAVYSRLLAEDLARRPTAQARPVPPDLPPALLQEARQILADCRNPPLGDAPYAISGLLIKVAPYLSAADGRALVQSLSGAACLTTLREREAPWAALLQGMLDRTPRVIGSAATQLLENGQGATPVRARYLLGMAMLGHLAGGQRQQALDAWQAHAARALGDKPAGFELEVLHALALTKEATPAQEPKRPAL